MRKELIAGALALTMSAGSASATSWSGHFGTPGVVEGVSSAQWTQAVGITAGTFAAWTVYRFFQNCGPFRCN